MYVLMRALLEPLPHLASVLTLDPARTERMNGPTG